MGGGLAMELAMRIADGAPGGSLRLGRFTVEAQKLETQ